MVLKSAELINGERRMGGDRQGALAEEEKEGEAGWRKLTLASTHCHRQWGSRTLVTHTHSQTLFTPIRQEWGGVGGGTTGYLMAAVGT